MGESRVPETPLLAVEGLNAWYGESHVLHGVHFEVHGGEVVTLIGRNGAGKTTTLRAIMGMVPRRRGSVRFGGRELIADSSIRIAREGIGYVPEDRAIFSGLTVAENLMLPPQLQDTAFTVERIHALFPNLRERANSMGTQLSGGEQQMLAIARVLRTGRRFVLLDEPTEGLAPIIVRKIEQVIQQLKQEGFTVVLVEQNLEFAATVADRYVVIEQGRTVETLTAADEPAGNRKLQAYLGI